MKKLLFIISMLTLLGSALCYSHLSGAQNLTRNFRATSAIHLEFQNNSLLPGNFIIKVQPRENEPYGVATFTLFSFGKYKGAYRAGTRIYLISEKERQSLMKGEEIAGKLLIEVKTEDEGKVVKLLP